MRALAVMLMLCSAAVARAGETIVFGDSGATVTHDCAAQPKVAVNGARNAITLTGACTRVAVNGTGNTVTIAAVTALAVSGSSNSVTVDTAGKIAITGTQNKVTWKSGKHPKVSSSGIGNTVAHEPPTATATSRSPASAASARRP